MKCVCLAVLLCGVFLTPPTDSLFKKLHHIKNLHQLKARLFKTDEPEDCHIFYEDHTTPHCSTTYNEVGDWVGFTGF